MSRDGLPRCFGVFGDPIGHSASPRMHQAAFDALGLPHRYLPFQVPVERLGEALGGVRALRFGGVNLTVPLKQAALPWLDEVSERARRIGAVNTVGVRDGALWGDNTDGEGFWRGLAELGGGAPRRAVVLGGGGASLAVVDALVHGGRVEPAVEPAVEVAWVSRRSGELPVRSGVATWGYEALPGLLERADLLVDTTTVGMTGGPSGYPVPIEVERMPAGAKVVDLVYGGSAMRTDGLLDRAARAGAAVQDGLPMLLWQGVAALQRWLGFDPLPESAVAAMREALER